MRPETKTCQNCHKDFTIELEDFNFYEKIKVPPPTFCPECRLIRRMTWRNERSLYKRKCDKTGKEIITMFHPDENVVVYDHDIWWSDQWEPTDYGKEYDFSKPFFQQFKELLKSVPLANLGNDNCVGSPYGNHNVDCKNCYLLYAAYGNERVNYSAGTVGCKDCVDVYKVGKSELSYGDVLCDSLYKTHYSVDTDESVNSFYLKHCKNLQDSIGCVNLRNKSHCILNQQYSKDEYENRKEKFDFGSYTNLRQFEKQFEEFALKFPNRYANIIKSVNTTGDNIMNSKNIQNSFDVFGDAEDSKHLTHILGIRDSYDLYGAGGTGSFIYEGVDTGIQIFKELFAVLTHSSMDTFYTYMCFSSKNLFGCIGLRGKQYCILNKQYSKEEYFELVPRIIDHMKDMPYVDKKGRIYKFGEFFPSELSPFAYNETIAQEYFPKSKQEIVESEYNYREISEKDNQGTINGKDLPDHIKDIDESILSEIISCPNGGDVLTQCTKAYRIIKSELDFLKNNNIALPRYCPNCRHYQRLKQRNPFKLWNRTCQCGGVEAENKKYKNTIHHSHGDGPCPNKFETSYSPDRPEIVYCEKCYQAEVY